MNNTKRHTLVQSTTRLTHFHLFNGRTRNRGKTERQKAREMDRLMDRQMDRQTRWRMNFFDYPRLKAP